MDVYVKRTYDHPADHQTQCLAQYPFYDYRSRRHSTGFAFCPTEIEGNDVPVTENGAMPLHLHPTQAHNSVLSLDPCRVTLHIIANACQAVSLFDLYQDVINWVDPHLRLFRVTEREGVICELPPASLQDNSQCSDIPAIAIMIFLKCADQNGNNKEETGSSDRSDVALQMFQHLPWRFHHSEELTLGKINVVSSNSQDFYYTSADLPLWAVRRVHYGREHVRYVLYISELSWSEQVHFYELILGVEPEMLREDFCLFTVYTQGDYDVQFALKKLDSNVNIITLENVNIHVKVKDIGLLVPLFPNVCRPISDVRWQTTDHDGNVIVLDSSQGYSSASNNNNNNTPYLQSSLSKHSERVCTPKEKSVGKTKLHPANNRHVGNNSFHESDLSITPGDTRRFLYTQQLHTSSSSFDFDDFDIDLPSPPLRHASNTEEDEESLCLTSTSEESGIQMQHGSEDLSFCEEESLRSCLSKNSALKIRHVKFKVRFKEEVEAFEDSFSRFSSGIDSESQSDAEMETNFRYSPSYTVNSPNYKEEHSNKGSISLVGNDIRTSFLSSSKSSFHKESNNFLCSVSSADYRMPPDTSTQQCPPKCQFSNAGDTHDLDNFSHIQEKNHINKELLAATVLPKRCHQQNHITPHCPSSSSRPCASTIYDCVDKHEMCLRKMRPDSISDVCRHCSCSKTQTCTSIYRPLSSNKPRIKSTSFRDQTNIGQINSRTSSNITLAKSNRERQHKNRSPSVNIREKKETQLSTPSANACRNQLISVEPNPLDNKTLPETRPQCNPFPQLQHFQNGQKMFWFHESNKDLAQNGSSDLADTTLKFTLKFDTCPTSGLSSKQEQIGFYV